MDKEQKEHYALIFKNLPYILAGMAFIYFALIVYKSL